MSQTPVNTQPGPPTTQARRRSQLVTAGKLVAAAVVAGVVAVVALAAIARVQWPAFPSSNVTGALTTTGQVVAVAVLMVAILSYRARRFGRWVEPLTWLGIAGFTTVTLAMPLGASKLYLFGISVDQQFRTEYLTRLTDSPHLADMTYLGLPPYYPAGWFWLGGRYAALTGQAGWEAFKPWSIITLAVASVVAMVLWTRMVRTDRAVALTLATTVTTLMFAATEPYSAVLVLVGPPVLIMLLHGLRSGSVPPLVVGGVFLGISASFYTLFTGVFALTAVMITLWLAVTAWRAAANPAVPTATTRATRVRELVRLALRLGIVAVIAVLIALVVWTPYLVRRLTNQPASGGTAEHYLPVSGSTLPLPMFEFSFVGALCLVGTVWLILRCSRRTIALALMISVVTVYLFCLLSMAVTAIGTTLLSFRLEPVLIALLASAGVLGVSELAGVAVRRFGDVRTVIGVLAVAAAIFVGQSIPSHLSSEITLAYTDTDGTGVRADKRPPGAEAQFPAIDALIRDQTRAPRDQTVVLTADYGFLSIYPYRGLQGLTSHYANPLAEFDKRAATIEAWSKLGSAADLLDALDHSPWAPPTVFLFRYGDDGYTLRLASDVYPNDPNVKRYTVTYDKKLFADPRFTVTEVGPFVLVVRR
ncbi:galactan 5-O-arabinofuranosyltransferase [Williamsia sterculiae]|uniref:Galactan 5-O-arabinofuranosyltransferase n=1 Tax=Williamsia sterculiae TaxID=1344003 RepID=A0A1N7HBB5_9NOCA|nr:galactan 5-O-arabinofuranosyltransferase [Williamsia sterculiae]